MDKFLEIAAVSARESRLKAAKEDQKRAVGRANHLRDTLPDLSRILHVQIDAISSETIPRWWELDDLRVIAPGNDHDLRYHTHVYVGVVIPDRTDEFGLLFTISDGVCPRDPRIVYPYFYENFKFRPKVATMAEAIDGARLSYERRRNDR